MEEMVNITTLDNKLSYLNDTYDTLRAEGRINNWSDFAKLIHVNRTCLSSAKGGDQKYLTDSLISKIRGYMSNRKKLSTINVDYYVANEDGQYEIEQSKSMEVQTSSLPKPAMKYVPTIPIHAYKAINFDVMNYFETTSDDLHMSPIIMQFPGTDCYYFVNSDEMSPNLRTNDLLCLSRLPDEAKVTNGDICIINTKYQGILGRFVYDDGDALILKSTQARWSDMRIPKDEVYSVFRILGGIRTNI